MPIYEYRCESCEHDLEAIQKFSDPELTDCPSCGAPKLRRQLSQSSFALKGGGWYADGYGSGKKAPAEAKAGEAKAGGGKSDGVKAEGKQSEGAKAGGKQASNA